MPRGAALFGYTKLYCSVPGAQAEYLRVPQAHFGPIKVSDDPPDDRFIYLSDVLPTAWQALEYAAPPHNGSLAVFGLGPIGQMCCRLALHKGTARVIGIDRVPERLERARGYGAQTLDLSEHGDIAAAVGDLTGGRGADAVIDAVGMEAHGSITGRLAHRAVGLMPAKASSKAMKKASVDRLTALHASIAAGPQGRHRFGVRRVWRHARPAPCDGAVRQIGPDTHGPGERPALG